jgi:catechol 2,3-dioxygenase-like lactoylglutathione lyase family enzyme
MEATRVIIKNAWPYQQDKMNLSVNNLEAAIPFYETIMGFRVVSRQGSPYTSATLDKNGFQLGLAENGGDQKHGDTNWKVFFVVAPDGLCYCYGERQP